MSAELLGLVIMAVVAVGVVSVAAGLLSGDLAAFVKVPVLPRPLLFGSEYDGQLLEVVAVVDLRLSCSTPHTHNFNLTDIF